MLDVNETLLDGIMRKKMFYHVFQPIYALENWKLFGYEALLRCPLFLNPERLFRVAMKQNRLYDLDICSLRNAISSVSARDIRLFVNVYPSTLFHSFFPDFLQGLQELDRNIVFEINEAEIVPDMEILRRAVCFLKEKGYKVAFDDFGKGGSLLQTVMELEPDFVKLDQVFAVNLSVSEKKQEVIQMLLERCREKNIRLILEGIEEAADLAMAKALGVHFGQGYLLGEPYAMEQFPFHADLR